MNLTFAFSIAMILLAFFCGSLPFSVWVGKLFLGVDVRQFGDGNPGAANVYKYGNKLTGILVMMLDISKAAVPVGLAYFNLHMRGATMFLIAIAPILGHAFSPFLGFKGGKAAATALGVWIGLTIWKASLPGALMAAIAITLLTSGGWAIMLALAGILIVLLNWLPEPLLLWVWLGETVILAWTFRANLRQRPHFRPWLARYFQRTKD